MRKAHLIVLYMLASCGDQGSDGAAASMQECLEMDAGSARNKCIEDNIIATFQEDEAEGQRIIREEVDDTQQRDFLWYMVTTKYDPKSDQYCREIQTEALAERCRSIVGRPHLHREIGDRSGKAGAGGGPAPGGGPPPQ